MRKNDPNARHSGRLMVRMPRELHDQLSAQAHEQRVPLNQLVVALLSGGVAWRAEPRRGSGAEPSLRRREPMGVTAASDQARRSGTPGG